MKAHATKHAHIEDNDRESPGARPTGDIRGVRLSKSGKRALAKLPPRARSVEGDKEAMPDAAVLTRREFTATTFEDFLSLALLERSRSHHGPKYRLTTIGQAWRADGFPDLPLGTEAFEAPLSQILTSVRSHFGAFPVLRWRETVLIAGSWLARHGMPLFTRDDVAETARRAGYEVFYGDSYGELSLNHRAGYLERVSTGLYAITENGLMYVESLKRAQQRKPGNLHHPESAKTVRERDVP